MVSQSTGCDVGQIIWQTAIHHRATGDYDGGAIELFQPNPQVIYVPVYQPDQVYYQSDYGSPFNHLRIGWPIGVWLNAILTGGTTISCVVVGASASVHWWA